MEKIINFTGELNDELGNYVVNELLDIYDKNKAIIETNERLKYQSDYLPLYADTVEFRINSNGGDLYKFLEIYDLMGRMKEEQSVIFKARVSSHAYSAGMYLFCACDYRTMSKFGSLMYHEMSMLRQDKLSDLESETHRMAKIQKILDDIVTRDTGLTQEILDSYRGRDFWLDFDEAVEYGIIKEFPSEEELKQQLLGGIEKETMTESEWDEFITELKDYVNIIPDEPTEETEQEELDEMYCIEKAICNEHEGTNKCCYFCSKYKECDMSCNFALEISEEFSCEYLTDEPVEESEKVSKDMEFDDCEFAKEKK